MVRPWRPSRPVREAGARGDHISRSDRREERIGLATVEDVLALLRCLPRHRTCRAAGGTFNRPGERVEVARCNDAAPARPRRLVGVPVDLRWRLRPVHGNRPFSNVGFTNGIRGALAPPNSLRVNHFLGNELLWLGGSHCFPFASLRAGPSVIIANRPGNPRSVAARAIVSAARKRVCAWANSKAA